jgi:hypothetical protein
VAFDQVGAYMWVFTPGGIGGGSWSYLARAALPFAPGDQTGNTSCGKYIWTLDGWIFNPKGATTGAYGNNRYYYIQGPDGKTYQFGSVPPPPINYDPQNRKFNYGGSGPNDAYSSPNCVEIGDRAVYCEGLGIIRQ